MEANQRECFMLEQSSVINILVSETLKPYEIYRRKCDVYNEACFSQTFFYK